MIKTTQKKFLLAGVTIVASILIYTAFSERGLLKVKQLLYDSNSINTQINLITDKNNKLKIEAAALSNEITTIEKAAREQLDLVKKNEVLYKFEDNK